MKTNPSRKLSRYGSLARTLNGSFWHVYLHEVSFRVGYDSDRCP